MRYDAFISYSHAADNAAAPALQAALHAFARPWNRMRALHVFRDQTSLAASPELWPAIEAALADSRWLLVMASPEAAASRWVGREIEWWLAQRSVGRLLIVLTDGELVWDEARGDFDPQRTTCLPPQVLSGCFANEPLWVDLRWAKSAEVLTLRHARFRQAVLDVAAPLHGRPKDELDGDDVRRFVQVQRLRAGAIAALAGLTLLAGGAAWVAVGQRNEARHQATIAQAGRIAVQADLLRERGGPTDASVMLAAEALRLLDGVGEWSADVDQSLRRALAGLPEPRGTLALSADAFRLTPDGARLVATHTGGRITVHATTDGSPRGCLGGPVREAVAGERQSMIDAQDDSGAWCVVHALLRNSAVHVLELWSAAPSRLVARVTLPSQAGHVRPAIAPGGRWLAATDLPQSGLTAGAVVRLWHMADDGRIGAPLLLPGMSVLGFSPDGRHLATSTGLWLLPDAVPGNTTNPPHTKPERRIAWDAEPWQIAFSRDSAHVATQQGPDTNIVVWDIASGNDRLRASPPPGTLLALGPGGARLIVAGADVTTLWDTELDVARARLPLRADTAALPGEGRGIFLAGTTTAIGLPRQRLLALPEDPAALVATGFPGAVDAVRMLSAGRGGDIDVVEVGKGAGDAGVQVGTNTLRQWRWHHADGRWTAAAPRADVAAFAAAPDGHAFALASGGRVSLITVDGSAQPRALAPAIAADALVFSGDGAHLIAHAAGSGGGEIHLWGRDGTHLGAVALAVSPAAMAVTRDGRNLLAVVATGVASRQGPSMRLSHWRLADAAAPTVVELGRRNDVPVLCQLLAGGAHASVAAIGVSAADVAGCNEQAPATVWRVVVNGRQATVFAPSNVAVARMDHAANVRQAVVSAETAEAVTLDESGRLQRFPLAPKDLIAQACARQPAPLAAELLLALPPGPDRGVDACGRPSPTASAPATIGAAGRP